MKKLLQGKRVYKWKKKTIAALAVLLAAAVAAVTIALTLSTLLAGDGDAWDLKNFITSVSLVDEFDREVTGDGDVFDGMPYTYKISFAESTAPGGQMYYTTRSKPHTLPPGTVSPDPGVLRYQLDPKIRITQNYLNQPIPLLANPTKIVGWYNIYMDGTVEVWFGYFDSDGNAFTTPQPGPGGNNYIYWHTDTFFTLKIETTFKQGDGPEIFEFDFDGNYTIEIPPVTPPPGELKIAKTATTDQAAETITHKITVNVVNGDVDNVVLTDFMKTQHGDILVNNTTVLPNPITVTKNGGAISPTITRTGNGNKDLTFSFGNLKKGDEIIITYTVQMKTVLDGYATGSLIKRDEYNVTLTNTATVTGKDVKNKQLSATTTARGTLQRTMLAKTGTPIVIPEGTGYEYFAKWTVTFGSSRVTQLNGRALTEILGPDQKIAGNFPDDVEVRVYGASGTYSLANLTEKQSCFSNFDDETGFTFTVPSTSAGGLAGITDIYQIVIIFTVELPGPGTYTNAIEYDVYGGSGTVTVTDPTIGIVKPSIVKDSKFVYDANGTPTDIKYTIVITVPAGYRKWCLQYGTRAALSFEDYIYIHMDRTGERRTISSNSYANGGRDFNAIVPWAGAIPTRVITIDPPDPAFAFYTGGLTGVYGNGNTVRFGGTSTDTDWPYDDQRTVTIEFLLPLSTGTGYMTSPATVVNGNNGMTVGELLELGGLVLNQVNLWHRTSASGFGYECDSTIDYYPIGKKGSVNEKNLKIIDYAVTLNNLDFYGVADGHKPKGKAIYEAGQEAIFRDFYDPRLEYVKGSMYIEASYNRGTGNTVTMAYSYYDTNANEINNQASRQELVNDSIPGVISIDLSKIRSIYNTSRQYNSRDDVEQMKIDYKNGNKSFLYRSWSGGDLEEHWYARDDVRYVVYYQMEVREDLTEEYGEYEFINTAKLEANTDVFEKVGDWTSSAKVKWGYKAVNKTMLLEEANGSTGIPVVMLVNPLGIRLRDEMASNDQITAMDIMTGDLEYYASSIKIYEETSPGSGTWVLRYDPANPPAAGETWSVTPVSKQRFDMLLLDEKSIKIEYTAFVTKTSGTAVFTNMIALYGTSHSDFVKVDKYEVKNISAGASAQRRQYAIYKRDKDYPNTGVFLPGAQFALYASRDEGGPFTGAAGSPLTYGDRTNFYKIADATTNGNGIYYFDSEWLTPTHDMTYMIVETTAPTGYPAITQPAPPAVNANYVWFFRLKGAPATLGTSPVKPVEVRPFWSYVDNQRPNVVDVPFNYKKTVEGSSAPKNFTFKIQEVTDATGATTIGSAVTVARGSGNWTYLATNLARPGSGSKDYFFKIEEVPDPAPGNWTFSGNKYIVKITVPSGTGNPTVEYLALTGHVNNPAHGTLANVTGDPFSSGVTFINRHSAPATPAKIAINVKKTVSAATGSIPSGNHEFGMTLYNSDAGGNEGTEKFNEVKIIRDASHPAPIAYFPDIEYSTAGTYYYLVKETSAPGGWSKDTALYHIRVEVTLDSASNSYVTTVDYRKSTGGGWGSWLSYSATYNPTGGDPSTMPNLTGTTASYTMFSKLPRDSSDTEFPKKYNLSNLPHCTMQLSGASNSRDRKESALLNALYPTNTSITLPQFNMLFGTNVSSEGHYTDSTLNGMYTHPHRDFIRAAAYLYEAAGKYSGFNLKSTITPPNPGSWVSSVPAVTELQTYYVWFHEYLLSGHAYPKSGPRPGLVPDTDFKQLHRFFNNMDEIIKQHNLGVTTSLSMTYTPDSGSTNSGKISFDHVGWVSKNMANAEQYDAKLKWSGGTATVRVNGALSSTGVPVKKTDTIAVTGISGPVMFTLTDDARYVKAHSIKGALYTPTPNVTTVSTNGDNEFLVGTAEFVKLSNTLTVNGSSAAQSGTPSHELAESTRYINPGATFTYIQTENHSNTLWCCDMNIQDLSLAFHNTYTPTVSGSCTLKGKKLVNAAGTPPNTTFTFTLTRVTDATGGTNYTSGAPTCTMPTPITATVTYNGGVLSGTPAGEFTFGQITNMQDGDYYFRIAETGNSAATNWAAVSTVPAQVIKVVVSGGVAGVASGAWADAGLAPTYARAVTPPAYPINSSTTYTMKAGVVPVATSDGDYCPQDLMELSSGGSKVYIGACGQSHVYYPETGVPYDYKAVYNRDHTKAALAAALMLDTNGARLSMQEWGNLFGNNLVGFSAYNRFDHMRCALWQFEETTGVDPVYAISQAYRDWFNDIMAAYDPGATGPITNLSLSIAPDGTLNVTHTGYQPMNGSIPLAKLTIEWPATTGLTVTKNGTAITSGTPFLTTDTIKVAYTGTAPVTLTVKDALGYLVNGSIKGHKMYDQDPNTPDKWQAVMTGWAEFVHLQAGVTVGGSNGGVTPTFRNRYQRLKAQVDLSGTKTVAGMLTGMRRDFYIYLTQADSAGNPYTGGQKAVLPGAHFLKFTANGSQSFTFAPITGLTEGTYYFLMTEEDPGGNFTQNRQYMARVVVSSALAVTTTYQYREWSGTAWGAWQGYTSTPPVITNTYTDVTAEIKVRKTFNPTGAPTEDFYFTITRVTDATGSTVMLAPPPPAPGFTDPISTETIGPRGAGDFSFHLTGLKRPSSGDGGPFLYYYKIVEEPFSITKWTPSTNVYLATVSVPVTGNPMVTYTRLATEGANSDAQGQIVDSGTRVQFINAYESPGDCTIKGKKVVNVAGTAPSSTTFTFTLTRVQNAAGATFTSGPTCTMPPAPITATATYPNTGPFLGDFTFPQITNMQDGTYYFKIAETSVSPSANWAAPLPSQVIKVVVAGGVANVGEGGWADAELTPTYAARTTPGSYPLTNNTTYSAKNEDTKPAPNVAVQDSFFTLYTGGTVTYYASCGESNVNPPLDKLAHPYKTTDTRDHTGAALAAALRTELSGSRLALEEFEALFGIGSGTTAQRETAREEAMKRAVWHYEESSFILTANPLTNYLPVLKNLMAAYNPVGTGPISTLAPGMLADGTLTYSYTGYVPANQDIMRVSWPATTGLTVVVSSGPDAGTYTGAGSNIRITRTNCKVTYTGTAPVTFTFKDDQNTLLNGSIKGHTLVNQEGLSIQRIIAGYAQFVHLQAGLTVCGSSGGVTPTFRNTYNEPKTTAAVAECSKEVKDYHFSGRGPIFYFNMKQVDINGNPYSGSHYATLPPPCVLDFSLNGTKTFAFQPIEGLTAAGSPYYFLITEETPGAGWQQNQECMVRVTVNATTLATTVEYRYRGHTDGVWNAWSGSFGSTTPTFVNTYSSDANCVIKGKKTVNITGTPPGGTTTFTFTLTRVTDATGSTDYNTSTDFPPAYPRCIMPVAPITAQVTYTSGALNPSDGVFSFPQIKNMGDGTYYFKITETGISPANPNWGTTPAPQVVTVVVADGEAVISGGGAPTFTNNYTDTPPTAAQLQLKKSVTNFADPKTFSFRIQQVQGDTEPLASAQYTDGLPVTTVPHAWGSTPLTYTTNSLERPGVGTTTYYYRIWEQMTAETGWDFSPNVYIARVVVGVTGAPTVTYIQIAPTVPDPTFGTVNNSPDGPVEFINKFTTQTASANLRLRKTVRGPGSGTFTFNIQQVKGAGAGDNNTPEPPGAPVQTTPATTGTTSTWNFATGTLDRPTNSTPLYYYYRISEDITSVPADWLYSPNVYIATVEVRQTGAPTVSYTRVSGSGTMYGDVVAETPALVEFINIHRPPAGAELKIRKTLEPPTPPGWGTRVFTFNIKQVEGTASPANDTKTAGGLETTFVNSTIGGGAANWSYALSGLARPTNDTTPNLYYYRISESATGKTTGWDYSGNIYIATVSVPMVGDPTVTYSHIVYDPDEGTYIAGPGSGGYIGFTNKYDAPEYDLDIGLTKTGSVDMALNQFTFDLWESNSTGAVVGGSPLTSIGNTAGNPVTIKFPRKFYEAHSGPDPYTYYVLKENVSGNGNGWSIDTKQYWIRVQVEGTDVTMTGHKIWYKEWNATPAPGAWDTNWTLWELGANEMTFDNKLKAKIELEKSGKEKNGTNAVPMIADQFTFELYETNAGDTARVMPPETVTNPAGTLVTIAFDEWEITSTATKYYVLKESAVLTPPNVNWTPSTKEYLIEVTVSGDPLRPVIKYKERAKAGDSWPGGAFTTTWDGGANKFSFVNEYDAPSTEFVPKVTKNATGRQMSDGLFSFALFPVTGPESGHSVGTTAIETKTNAASTQPPPSPLYTAEVLFSPISYSLADKDKTFYYLLRETSVNLNGWTINVGGLNWMFKVTVRENANGSLRTDVEFRPANTNGTYPAGSWTEYKPDDPVGGTNWPHFNNAFTPVSAELEGKKTVTADAGAVAPGKVFTFEIVACDSGGTPLTGATTYTRTASHGESFTYIVNDLIPGPQPYYFLIKEQVPPPPKPDDGWTYSANEYIATITVPEIVVGGVTYTVTYARKPGAGTDTPTDEAEFKNNYSAGKLTLNKEVDGAGADQDKPFIFTVTFSEDVTYNGVTGKIHTVTLSHNGPPAVFTNIPYGTTYDIAENPYVTEGYLPGINPAGYDEGVINGSNTAVTVTFTNTYVGINVTLIGAKEGVGGTMAAGQFSFAWYDADELGNAAGPAAEPNPANAAGGVITFPTLTYTVAREAYYYYLIEEVPYTVNDGWVSDTRQYHIRVKVEGTTALSTKIEVRTRANDEDEWGGWEDYEAPADITFTNYYGIPFEFRKTGGTDPGGNTIYLGGVEFILYKCSKPAHTSWQHHDEFDPDNEDACWVFYDEAVSAAGTGQVTFDLLINGVYCMAEVKTNPTYQLPFGQWLITVNVGAPNPADRIKIGNFGAQMPPAFKIEPDNSLSVANYKQFITPRTGSITGLLFSAGGTALVSLAAFFGVTTRRKRKKLSE